MEVQILPGDPCFIIKIKYLENKILGAGGVLRNILVTLLCRSITGRTSRKWTAVRPQNRDLQE